MDEQRFTTSSIRPWFAGVLASVFVFYPLSAGPGVLLATYITVAGWASEETMGAVVSSIYLPLAWFIGNAPEPLRDAFDWYLNLFAAIRVP